MLYILSKVKKIDLDSNSMRSILAGVGWISFGRTLSGGRKRSRRGEFYAHGKLPSSHSESKMTAGERQFENGAGEPLGSTFRVR
jgi:hypothetical protein